MRQEHARAKLTARALEEQEGIVAAKEAELEAARIDIRTSSEAATDAKAAAEEAEASAARLRAEAAEAGKRAATQETVIRWLNGQLTTAQTRDPGLRIGPPPQGLLEAGSAALVSTPGMKTSTPMDAGARKKKNDKENNLPSGLDEKYLLSSLQGPNSIENKSSRKSS